MRWEMIKSQQPCEQHLFVYFTEKAYVRTCLDFAEMACFQMGSFLSSYSDSDLIQGY